MIKMLPNFIGVGAQRAGTTWVYNCLRQHPEIFLPEKKELQFFNVNYERGIDWYQSHFTSLSDKKIVGEITPNYMHSEIAISRIINLIPNVKVFLILRNPFERAYSSYLLFKNTNKCNGMTFRDACENFKPVIANSLYAEPIERIYDTFKVSNVKIMLYDDLKSNNEQFLDELYAFLGVSLGFRPENIKVKYNKIMFSSVQKFLIQNHMEWIIEGIKKSPASNMIRQSYNSISQRKNTLSNEDFEYLNKYFKQDIYLTQKLIGKNLEFWLEK